MTYGGTLAGGLVERQLTERAIVAARDPVRHQVERRTVMTLTVLPPTARLPPIKTLNDVPLKLLHEAIHTSKSFTTPKSTRPGAFSSTTKMDQVRLRR